LWEAKEKKNRKVQPLLLSDLDLEDLFSLLSFNLFLHFQTPKRARAPFPLFLSLFLSLFLITAKTKQRKNHHQQNKN